ncbi:MAG: ATP-binding protein [Steroidobacteraceae bacterium]
MRQTWPRAGRIGLVLCGLLLAAGCVPHTPDVRHITRAEVYFEPIPDAEIARPAKSVPQAVPWRSVALPYDESRRETMGLSPAGPDHSVRLWVRLPAQTVPTDELLPLAVHYAAYSGPIRAANVYVAGERIGGTDPEVSSNWNRPAMFVLPAQVTHVGESARIVIAFNCVVGVLPCAAPTLYVGPQRQVERRHEWQRFLRNDGPRIGSIAMLMLGLFALLFWLGRPRELVYPLFALASLIWALRTLHYHLAFYPGDGRWFWWMTENSMSWLMVVVYVFAFRLHDERHPYIERGLLLVAIGWSVATMPGLGLDGWAPAFLTHVMRAVIAVGVTVLISISSLKSRSREHLLLAIGLWICIGMGIHDILLLGWYIDFERTFLLPYGAMFLFAAFLYAIVRKYAAAIAAVETVNASLEERLSARQAELQVSYEKLRLIERQQAETAERQRLMREMHDGLGSSLMSSLVMVEQGKLAQSDIVQVLRECVDDLKLTIDSLEPIGDDLLTLLATLRYRVGSRLEAARIKLEWRVTDLPPLPWLNPTASLHILRILQEALTNIVKHAHASTIRIETAADNETVFVRVMDDGRGFDPAAIDSPSAAGGGGRGLLNLRRRAVQIGGRIDIRSGAAGTTVELSLPRLQAGR